MTLPSGAYRRRGLVAATPAPGGGNTLSTISMPSRGFFSGMSQGGASGTVASFGAWRGDPVDFVSIWHDGANGATWSTSNVNSDSRLLFQGPMDIAIGGPSDYAAAAGGSLDSALRTYLTALKARRTINGTTYLTVLRPCHEMNGDFGYAWQLQGNATKTANFRTTMKRWRDIRNEVFPEAVWALSFNGESQASSVSADIYEAGVWDMIGTDRYNQWPYIGTANNGTYTSFADGSTRGTDSNPIGVERWRLFAQNRGLPLYLPEYANASFNSDFPAQGGRDPYWVQQFYAWAQANGGKGAGKVFAESWFNEQKEGNKWHLYVAGGVATDQQAVADAYAAIHPIN